jgi:probable rRNA maturation factor
MRSKTSSPTVINCQRAVPVAVADLASFFERVRRELFFPEGSVTVRLISDSAMARLNGSFRGKRGPTDVLSFPATADARPRTTAPTRRRVVEKNASDHALSDETDDELNDADAYVGDIAISPRTAARNARADSRTLQAELRILILHGMIHLAGYDHETDHGEMSRLEMRLRRRLNVIANEAPPARIASRTRTKSTQTRPPRTEVRLQR